jgi:DNA mismatch repair protein MSH5
VNVCIYLLPFFFPPIDIGVDDTFRLPYSLDIRQSKEFNYESSKTKLINLRLGENDGPSVRFTIPGDVVAEGTHGEADDGGAGRHEHLLRLSGWVDLDCALTVRFYSLFNSGKY